MPILGKLTVVATLGLCAFAAARGQDLAPRAYVITPAHWNAFTLTYSYYSGTLLFDGAVPVTGATANISVPVATIYHSMNFFGRSANIIVGLPYGVGNYQGHVLGAEPHLTGPDCWIRFTVFR